MISVVVGCDWMLCEFERCMVTFCALFMLYVSILTVFLLCLSSLGCTLWWYIEGELLLEKKLQTYSHLETATSFPHEEERPWEGGCWKQQTQLLATPYK